MEFPFENTYYTDVDMDELNLIDEEILKIAEFKKQILENPKNYDCSMIFSSVKFLKNGDL